MPTVQIELPVDGLQVDVYDTIHITVRVADTEGLDYLQVRLLTTSQSAVMPTVQLETSGTGGTLQLDYVLDDITLETGQYYLEAKVYDEVGYETHDFVLINVTAVPKELFGVFAVLTTPGFVSLHMIDAAWATSIQGVYAADYTDMAVSSWWQQVAFTGSSTGMFRAISLDGVRPGWTLNAFPTAGPYWGGVFSEGKNWLISFRSDGLLKKYSWNGSSNDTYLANSGFHFGAAVFSGDKLFAEMEDFALASRVIGVFVNGGGAIQQAVMNLDPVGFFPRDATTIYAVGNWNNQGKLLMYDYDSNGFWEPISLPAGQILSATEVDVNTLLIAMDNGNIYKFTYSPLGLLNWYSTTAQHIRYDVAGSTVITSEGVAIKQYNYPVAGQINSTLLTDTAADIELWYNR